MKSKNKDRKPHESIIGKIIYGFLLFMPLLAIGVTCAYAIFNKNAYQSYYGETINESEKVDISFSNLETQNKYYVVYSPITNGNEVTESPIGGSNYYVNVTNVEIINNSSTIDFSTMTSFFYYKVASEDYVRFYYKLNNQQGAQLNRSVTLEFSFDLVGTNFNEATYNLIPFFDFEYNSYSFVSEVFYYSIDKVQQSPLFNWAEDSAIYTGMTATCNALNITTTFIPLLMTYWLIISVIYILYDIILIILHIFHKKIHQLEDSF